MKVVLTPSNGPTDGSSIFLNNDSMDRDRNEIDRNHQQGLNMKFDVASNSVDTRENSQASHQKSTNNTTHTPLSGTPRDHEPQGNRILVDQASGDVEHDPSYLDSIDTISDGKGVVMPQARRTESTQSTQALTANLNNDSSGNNDDKNKNNRQKNNSDMNARQVESTIRSNSDGTNDTCCVVL